MQLLTSSVRHYSWGSRTLIPELMGQVPSPRPVAELWFGAHPAGPSTVDGRPLDEMIEAEPACTLGERVRGEFGDRLPFLMKILAAGEPLSLQAHPTMEQAQEGFERENAAGIPLDGAQRNYKDASHKPEIIVALTEFYAMAGFRPLDRTRELFAALNCDSLRHYESMLDDAEGAEESNLRVLFTTWITIPAGVRGDLIRDIVAAAREYVATAQPGDWKASDLQTIIELDEQYPGDAGVLGALLLNHIHLSPGEAAYLDAGQLHAYVRGMGVEVMANSDNVLRGGLTPKHVDVPELVRVLKFEALASPQVQEILRTEDFGMTCGQAWDYPVPVEEFALQRCELSAADQACLDADGPRIVLCTAGSVRLIDTSDEPSGEAELVLEPGQAAWVPACDAQVMAEVAAGSEQAQMFLAGA